MSQEDPSRANGAQQIANCPQHELQDRLLRALADLDNYRKRAKREIDEAARAGRESLLRELLPAFDNFERALQHSNAGDALATGLRIIEGQLLDALGRFGVIRFNAHGEPFDPARHEAIDHVETSALTPGTVAQVFSSGYLSGTRLVRPAVVSVAKSPLATARSSKTSGAGGPR